MRQVTTIRDTALTTVHAVVGVELLTTIHVVFSSGGGYDGGGGSGGGGGSCRCWTGSAHQLVCMFCACPVVMVVGVRVMVAF